MSTKQYTIQRSEVLAGAYKFPKSARLCGKQAVEALHTDGQGFFVHPYKVKYQLVPAPSTGIKNQVLVVVGKRSYKRAVDRATMKRRIREAWRLNRPHLLAAAGENSCIRLAIMLVGNELYSAEYLQKRLILVVKKLNELLASPPVHVGNTAQ